MLCVHMHSAPTSIRTLPRERVTSFAHSTETKRCKPRRSSQPSSSLSHPHHATANMQQHCWHGHSRPQAAGLACRAQSAPKEEVDDEQTQSVPEVALKSSITTQSITKFLAALFLTGAILGPLLDGIHGTVELNQYDVLPVSIGGLHSSVWVSPLLGSFYAIAGGLIVALDWLATSDMDIGLLGPLSSLLRSDENTEQTGDVYRSRTALPQVALATGALAYLLELSANLYGNDVPYWQIHLALAAAAALNWLAFDGTRQGIVLALVCGISAPVSEVVIMRVFGLWHYPKPDLLGLPSWVAWCYAFYVPALSNLARRCWQEVNDTD